MKLKVKCCFCLAAIFIVMYFSVRSWNMSSVYLIDEKYINELKKPMVHDVMPEDDVTLVFRYTHETSKHLPTTVNAFLENFPHTQIIIVSDSNVPLDVAYGFTNSTNIRFIPLKLDLMRLIDRNVANYITTKYVLVVPNDVYPLLPIDISSLVNVLYLTRMDFIALPIARRQFSCLRINMDLLLWTVQYEMSKFGAECDYVKGEHGIFMESITLRKIGEPFMSPFPEAFYLQATALSLKVQPVEDVVLRSDSKKVKRIDFLKKYQIQQQLLNKLFKIKKVIRETGVTEWYGCTRKTQRCFPDIIHSMPEYLNQGRWTPPCCLKVLREIVHHVFKILREWKVTFWLEGGSLLGAVRNRDIIPWDYDVDIGVYMEEVNKCPWLRALNEGTFKKTELPSIVDNEGFVWEKSRPEEGDFYRVQASEHNRLHIDIFPFYSDNGIMTKKTWFADHPQDKEFPEHYLKPLTTIDFAGVRAPAPNNVKEFLELKFGKGCVENPQYPNPKFLQFPESAKELVINDTYNYDMNINFFN